MVHLVQRPPPGSTPRGTSVRTEDRPRRHAENGRNNLPIFQVIDGTVLGAMAIPMNTNSGVSEMRWSFFSLFFFWSIRDSRHNCTVFLSDHPIGYTNHESIVDFVYESYYRCAAHAQLCQQHSQLFGESRKGKFGSILSKLNEIIEILHDSRV